MVEIVKGTTPTLQFTFNSISPSSITTAILTIKCRNTIVLRKELSEATVTSKAISWKLTQAETLGINGLTEIVANWLTSGGVRGVSQRVDVRFTSNPIEEVIS